MSEADDSLALLARVEALEYAAMARAAAKDQVPQADIVSRLDEVERDVLQLLDRNLRADIAQRIEESADTTQENAGPDSLYKEDLPPYWFFGDGGAAVPLPFRVSQYSDTLVAVEGGIWERNGVPLTLANTNVTITQNAYIELALDTNLNPSILTVAAVATRSPEDLIENRFKVLAYVEFDGAKITSVTPYWLGNIDDLAATPDDHSLEVNTDSGKLEWLNWTTASAVAPATDDMIGMRRVVGATPLLVYGKLKRVRVIQEGSASTVFRINGTNLEIACYSAYVVVDEDTLGAEVLTVALASC